MSAARQFTSNGTVVHTGSTIGQLKEALPWWNVTQGGVSGTSGEIHGLQIGKSEQPGELLNSRTLFTRFTYAEEGKVTAAPARVGYIQEAMGSGRQIGVVVKSDHQDLGVHLPESEVYALMGFWRMTGVYAIFSRTEENKIVKTWMVRLDKVDVTSGIWWRSPQQVQSELQSNNNTFAAQTCPACGMDSPKIFKLDEHFVCTNLDCTSNRIDTANPVILPRGAEYHEDYVKWRPNMTDVAPAPAYLPPAPSMPLSKIDLDALIAADNHHGQPMWPGYICSQCGAINLRNHVSDPECHQCEGALHLPPPVMAFEEVSDPEYLDLRTDLDLPEKASETRNGVTLMPPIVHPDYLVRRWKLSPDFDAYVMVLYPKRHTIYARDGPRDKFNTLMNMAHNGQLNYRRLELKDSKIVKGRVTCWFGQNIGAEYKTRMNSQETNLDLSAAPQVIRDIITHLEDTVTHFTAAAAAASSSSSTDAATSSATTSSTITTTTTVQRPRFNEILAMCYFPNMSMGWHSDGETSILGDAVASQSLGSTALMTFGVCTRVWAGRDLKNRISTSTSADDDTAAPIFEGSKCEIERRELKRKFEAGEITADEHLQRLRTLLANVKQSASPAWCLRFQLPSGAIMVQVGKDVNRFWQHKIDFEGPEARIRFVNTARYLSVVPAGTGGKKRKRRGGTGNDSDDDTAAGGAVVAGPSKRRNGKGKEKET